MSTDIPDARIARPLPSYLVQRYLGWQATTYAENKVWYRRLADEGQKPRAMVISCCDSRVNATSLFGADHGEFFIHQNVANLVPPCAPDGDYHGTSAAVEFAVQELRVPHLIVLGHSRCGGVRACHDMCAGDASQSRESTSFTGRWMELLRPAYTRCAGIADRTGRLTAMEQDGVLTSLANLATFPFVRRAVATGQISLHGLWTDIAEGTLEHYDAAQGAFVAV